MSMTMALAGNPNSGKTTLFNALTGASQYVGNWPGVTVEKKEGRLRGHKDVKITDLPGIYSLSPYTLEEVIARDYLLEADVDVVINLVDGSNLERNLYLTTQVIEMGLPVVVALNMMDLVKKRRDKIDVASLSGKLGCPVIPITAVRGEGIDELIEAAIEAAEAKTLPNRVRLSDDLEAVLDRLYGLVDGKVPETRTRWAAIKLFERDRRAIEKLMLPEAVTEAAEPIIAAYEAEKDDDSESLLTSERYEEIANLLSTGYVRARRAALSLSDKIDRVVTNRVLGLPIFIAVMFFVYWLATFGGGPGTIVTDWTNDVFVGEIIAGNAEAWLEGINAAPWLTGLLVDGIIAGVGAVIGFLPQMAILFIMLSLLEQIGYMARIAFLMDRLFRKFGLSGKSFIPILISSGCAVPGIMATRTIENDKDRRMTVMLTPFIPCGAKLPLIAMIAGAMFGDAWWFAPVIYFCCIAAIIVGGIILKKTRWFAGEPAPFVMELPPYHLPRLKALGLQVWERIRSFIVKAGTIILLSSIVIWLLSSFSWSFRMVDSDQSILASIGRFFAPIFAPLGFGRWEAVVGTISGLVAKENLISSMAILIPDLAAVADDLVEESEPLWPYLASWFTTVGGFSFLLFNMLCAPCFAAIGSSRREMGSAGWTWATVGFQTGFAYVISFCYYQLASVIVGDFAFNFVTVIAIVVTALVLFLLFRPDPYKRRMKMVGECA